MLAVCRALFFGGPGSSLFSFVCIRVGGGGVEHMIQWILIRVDMRVPLLSRTVLGVLGS